jgi:hypothetical protein
MTAPEDEPLTDAEVDEFETEQREWHRIGVLGGDPNGHVFDVGPDPEFSLRLVATIRYLDQRPTDAEYDAIDR